MRRLLLLLLLCHCLSPAWAQGSYWQLQIQGPIGPGVALHVTEELSAAASAAAPPELVLLLLDTPGGLYEAMRAINQAMLASPVPVVVYVYPEGARAASAGTYILYASHVAAMAPATHLGAATPVSIGGPPRPDPPQEKRKPDGQDEQKAPAEPEGGVMAHKQLNDAIAYLRSLAKLRGRNSDWAEQAVREAATLTASEALQAGVIELVAADIPSLLTQLDGREVALKGGVRKLATRELVAEPRLPDWRMRFLTAITDPNIAYILMLLGIYGLLLEFYTPGFGVAGVTGAICLLLALYALQMLPLNYAGLALLLLGLALLIAEAMLPSFGILGFGGLLAFVLGSVLLFDSADAAYRIAWPLIAAFAASSLLFLLVVLRLLLRQRRVPPVSGVEAMLGQSAIVLADFDAEGQVRLAGEIWQAQTEQPLHQGQTVRITAVEGLRLRVEPSTGQTNEVKK